MKTFFNVESIKDTYDVIILGAGPAGCSAATYTARDGLSTLVLEQNCPGGNIIRTDVIENCPGIDKGITGQELANRFLSQASNFGAQIRYGVCDKISLTGDYKVLSLLNGKTIKAKALIIATGSTPKKLGIPGEDNFIGRGISYCATCDGALYKNKEVVVVGGGEAALKESAYLTRFVSKIIGIHRRNKFRASAVAQQTVLNNNKIEYLLNSIPTQITGIEKVNGMEIKNKKTGKMSTIKTDGVFIFIGCQGNTNLFKDILPLTSDGFIKAKNTTETGIPGVFAAGDVRDKKYRQIATAVADGVVAAKMSYDYIGIKY